LIHFVEGGIGNGSSVLFLHGWPESWESFEALMILLAGEEHVIAIDLPGVGASKTNPPSNGKRTLAKYVKALIGVLGLQNLTLIGHDVGGQIVYSYLHAYPHTILRAAMMNIVVPGVEPWSEVVRNPHIWHFGFHSVPDLPEKLVEGREANYFDSFYDELSGPVGVSKKKRKNYVKAYSRPEALQTGFEWYRAFAQDEKDNQSVKEQTVQTPVLYLRGDQERGDLESYVKGFREAGLRNIQGQLIVGSGHFAPEEQPKEVFTILSNFMQLTD
jgi:pimeloyl-ACP methyl ester carboxylesterase